MSLLVSVLTPRWLVHVSDAGAGVPRTIVVRRPNARALVTLVGPEDLVSWLQSAVGDRAFADADELAGSLADRANAGAPASAGEVSLAITGWGVSSEGRDVSYRYLVTNFEDADATEPGFVASGETMVPSPLRPGGKGSRPITSYSVVVSATEDLSNAARREIEDLPRMLKKQASATDVAMKLAAVISKETGKDAVLVHLVPEGDVEAAIIGPSGVVPLAADATIGAALLVPQR